MNKCVSQKHEEVTHPCNFCTLESFIFDTKGKGNCCSKKLKKMKVRKNEINKNKKIKQKGMNKG